MPEWLELFNNDRLTTKRKRTNQERRDNLQSKKLFGVMALQSFNEQLKSNRMMAAVGIIEIVTRKR